jgi:predicted methyltransferase
MKIQRLGRTSRLILRDLSRTQDGLYAFTIYRRYPLSPAEISKALRLLTQSQVITLSSGRAVLTELGRQWVRAARLELWETDFKPWRECPQEFKQDAIPINKPYAPQINLLDKRFFPSVRQMDKGK